MRFVINISVDNAAFEEARRESEIAEILGRVQQRLLEDDLAVDAPIRLWDHNGNRVGYAILEEEA